MKITKFMGVVAICALVGIASADNAKAVISQKAKEFDRAMMTKNLSWFEKTAAADYHELDQQGHKIDRKTAMAQMRAQMPMMTVTQSKTSVVSASEKNGIITAVLTSKMSAKMMTSPKSKKMSALKMDDTFQEQWRKVGKDWKIFELKLVKTNMTMDGKPIKM